LDFYLRSKGKTFFKTLNKLWDVGKIDSFGNRQFFWLQFQNGGQVDSSLVQDNFQIYTHIFFSINGPGGGPAG